MDKSNLIKITHFINPHLFWFQFEQSLIIPNKALIIVENEIQNLCQHLKVKKDYKPEIGEIVAVLQVNSAKWIRARVEVKCEFNFQNDRIILWAIDLGIPFVSNLKSIKPIPKHLGEKNVNSVFLGGVNNLVPSEQSYNFLTQETEIKMKKTWSKAAVDHFEELINNSEQIAFDFKQNLDYHLFGELEFLTYENKKINLSDVLMKINQGILRSKNIFLNDLKELNTTNIKCYNNNDNQLLAKALRENINTCYIPDNLSTIDNKINNYYDDDLSINKVKEWTNKNENLNNDLNINLPALDIYSADLNDTNDPEINTTYKHKKTNKKSTDADQLLSINVQNIQPPPLQIIKPPIPIPKSPTSSVFSNLSLYNRCKKTESVFFPSGFDLDNLRKRNADKNSSGKSRQFLLYNLNKNNRTGQDSSQSSQVMVQNSKKTLISSIVKNQKLNEMMFGPEENKTDNIRSDLQQSENESSTTQFNNKRDYKTFEQNLLCVQNDYLNTTRKNYDINVLVHGKNIPVPINKIAEANFIKEVHDDLIKKRIKETFRIQSYSWPHIMRGNSLTMISSSSTGKTIGYMPAILSIVKRKIDDELFIKTVGPISIIICSSSGEVDNLYRNCKKFIDNKMQIIKAYGLRDIVDVLGALLNGCAILITTPKCLIRLMMSDNEIKIFDKKRLQHLIIDNIDLMFDNFKDDLQFILKKLLTIDENGHIMQQIIITSKIWHSFLRSTLKMVNNSILIIGAYIESIVYGKSQISLSLQEKHKKFNAITEFLSKHDYNYERTIIVCVNQDEVDEVVEYLKVNTILFIKCHEQSTEYEIELAKEWTNHIPGQLEILICADSILMELKILNATNLIHFTLSSSWTKFSFRFSTIFNSITDYLKQNIIEKAKPNILILLDETNTKQLPRLIDFLRLHNPECVTKEILSLSNKLKIKIEEQKSIQPTMLCKYLLEYGICKLERCKNRHILMKTDRQHELYPTKGMLKLKILSVITPTHFTARLLYVKDHTQINSEWKLIDEMNNFSAFNLKLKEFYLSNSMCPCHYPLAINDICAYKDGNSVYHRCEIITITELKLNASLIMIRCIDTGDIFNCGPGDLFYLSDEFKLLPPQAIDVRLTGLIPLDFDLDWDTKAIKTIENWLTISDNDNFYIRATIDLALNSKIWTNSLEIVEFLNELKSETLHLNIKANLIEKQFAIPYDEPLKLLKQMAVECGIITQTYEDIFELNSNEMKILNNAETDIETEIDLNSTQPESINLINFSDSDDDKSTSQNLISLNNSFENDNNIEEVEKEENVVKRLTVKQTNFICLKDDFYERIIISAFLNPNHFFIRIDSYHLDYNKILYDIDEFTKDKFNLKPKTFHNLNIGEMYLVQDDNKQYCRGIIYDIDAIQYNIIVWLCDEGTKIPLLIENIYEIPENLINQPYQAIQCKLIGIQSNDKNNVWKNEICDEIYYKLLEKNWENLYIRSFITNKTQPINNNNILMGNEYEVILIDCTTNEHFIINKLIVEKEYGIYDEKTKHYLDIVIDLNKSVEDNLELEKYDENDDDQCNENELTFDIEFDIEDFRNLGNLPSTLKILLPPKDDDDRDSHINSNRNIQKATITEESDTSVKEENQMNLGNDFLRMPSLIFTNKYPNVTWHQNNFDIILIIAAIDIIKYSLNVKINQLQMSLIFEEKQEFLNFNLLGCIDEELTFHEIRGLNIFIQLKKKMKGLKWSRLTIETDNHKWLTYNINHITTEETFLSSKPSIVKMCDEYDDEEESDFSEELDCEIEYSNLKNQLSD